MSPHVEASPRRLRVALIGCGKMGVHHLRAIVASGKADVVGIADPLANREDLGALITTETVLVASAAEMLERAKPDVVHIVTPPASHADLAILAIEAGCHVYVEKPFTPTRPDAERILSLAADRGVTLCPGHQVLFEAPALEAARILPSIGRVVHIESLFSFKQVRRNITAVDQVKDILPHAVYPVVAQMRAATGVLDQPIAIRGLTVRTTGDVYALVQLGSVTAILLVTLTGRPVEQYQHIIGTNGSLRADYIAGSLITLTGPGTGPGVLFTPYRRSWQTLVGATRSFSKILLGKSSYPGLKRLVASFYDSIQTRTAPPLSPASILDTVDLCEQIGRSLDTAEASEEEAARASLRAAEAVLPRVQPEKPLTVVTGGTGQLGAKVAMELRNAGYPVRVLARRMPPFTRRRPGIDYVVADLARPLDPSVMQGVGALVHCAAETAGGKDDHRRNSIDATRHVIEAAARAGATRVVHISSIAVLKTSREMGRAIDETVPLDADNPARGPYVWGKAQSELVANELQRSLGFDLKIIRPGPLVDYAAFQTPGRLGREVGPFYVAIGPKSGALSVCDVSTAARVIRSYLDDFAAAPPVVNLVEAPPPLRRELLARFTAGRPDLRVMWIPAWFLRVVSGPLKLVQRFALGSQQPLDVAAAFASERYQTDVAARVIARSKTHAAAPALTHR